MTRGAIIGVVPSPVTGMTIATSVVAQQASELGNFSDWTFSRPKRMNSGAMWSAYKHFNIYVRVCLARLRRFRTVYICAESSKGLICTFGLSLLSKLLSLEVVLHHHSSSYIDNSNRWMNNTVKYGQTFMQHVVLSESVMESFKEMYRPKRITVLSNAGLVRVVSRSVARPNETQHTDLDRPAVIGFLGRISDEKGLAVLENTLPMIDSAHDNYEVLIAGPFPSPNEKQRLESLLAQLDGKGTYLGPLYGGDKFSFLASLDLFLMPTQYVNEAQPLVIWEAASVGTPTLAIERGDIANQIRLLGSQSVEDEVRFFQSLSAWLSEFTGDQTVVRKSTLAAFETCADKADTQLEMLLNVKGADSSLCQGRGSLP